VEPFLIILAIVVGAFILDRLLVGRKLPMMLCTRCGVVDRPQRVAQGTFGMEFLLWCLLIVPGLIYSIWRLTTHHNACAHCGSAELVPPDSPRGRTLRAQLSKAPST
jgi:hypothetical protein